MSSAPTKKPLSKKHPDLVTLHPSDGADAEYFIETGGA